TSTPGSGSGATFHATFQNGSASATVLPGPCPLGQAGCVQLTITGGFLVSGSVAGLVPGAIPTLLIPVTTGSGAPAGTRSVTCAAADPAGTAQCAGVVSDPGIIPAAGSVASYTGSGRA